MLRIRLDSKRTPKPDGKKKKQKAESEEPIEESVEEEMEVADEEPSGPAPSQANKWAKKQKSKKTPEFVDSFLSSNIDAVAYDPDKKQMWVRFLGKDVYTYFGVPLTIYRGFWSAPSKGHYFWEKIRKNKHIKYQKLTASLRWIVLSDLIALNSNKQANVASIAKSFKNKAKQLHHEWNVQPTILNVFNGKQVEFEEFIVDIVGYGNKIRVNIKDKNTEKIDFSTTSETDTQKVAEYILKRCEKKLQSLAASKRSTNIKLERAAVLQLLSFLKESMPEQDWSSNIQLLDNGFSVSCDNYQLVLEDSGEDNCHITLKDKLTRKSYQFTSSVTDVVSQGLSRAMSVILQGQGLGEFEEV